MSLPCFNASSGTLTIRWWTEHISLPPLPPQAPLKLKSRNAKEKWKHLGKENWTDLIISEEHLNTFLKERKRMKHDNEWKTEGIFQIEADLNNIIPKKSEHLKSL